MVTLARVVRCDLLDAPHSPSTSVSRIAGKLSQECPCFAVAILAGRMATRFYPLVARFVSADCRLLYGEAGTTLRPLV